MTIRIALLGTDNTHGHQFAGFINGWGKDVPLPFEWKHGFLPQFYIWGKALREAEHDPSVPVPSPDARVTSIWCSDSDSAALLARACGIERHTANPFDAIEGSDAVLILTEDPASHYELAKAALERGLPTFVDKPLTPDSQTNHRLAELAKRHHAPWFTGSAFRFSQSLRRFAATLPETVGPVTALYVEVAGPLDFYGIHAVEIANVLTPLDDVTELQGFQSCNRGGALLTLESSITVMIETIRTSLDPPGHAIVYGERGFARWEPSDGYLATLGMVTAFIQMAKTGIPPVRPEESLLIANLALEVTDAASRGAGSRILRSSRSGHI
jgi:predicted dehydrogenase